MPSHPCNPVIHQVLDVCNNRIARVEGLGALTRLEDLWLNDNQISDLPEIAPALAPAAGSLTTVYLKGNPAAGDPGYREFMLRLLPKLTQLDDAVLPPRG